MRIVAGKLRHRVIEMTNLETTRETQDKVRQAIFNMIGPYFDSGVCLDLFTGSGAMALEAYSRGMDKIILNDLSIEALNVAKKNCNSLGIHQVEYYNLDYNIFLNNYKGKVDLLILDPPYKLNDIASILEKCYNILNDKAIVVFEMGIDSLYPDSINDLKLIKNKEYGIKRVVIYSR